MKYFLPLIASLFISAAASAQITITAADMPVQGDMLTYTNATPTNINFSPADSGANIIWNYPLVPMGQDVDTYKTAVQVNAGFGSTISTTAFGYKVADSIPGLSQITAGQFPIPISISDIYTYFSEITTPRPAFAATAYSYVLANILPTPVNYSNPDVWYYFPLAYTTPHHTDSTHFSLTLSLMGIAGLKQTGYRKTRVDGWGNITTPYFTSGVNCIRVRSEIHEIDSVSFTGSTFGTPRTTIEYKWLANGEHYPALFISTSIINGNEQITSVRYRDTTAIDQSRVVATKPSIQQIVAYPNPATGSTITLDLPADWKSYQVEVFDITSKVVAAQSNDRIINVAALPAGEYLVRIMSGASIGYAKISK